MLFFGLKKTWKSVLQFIISFSHILRASVIHDNYSFLTCRENMSSFVSSCARDEDRSCFCFTYKQRWVCKKWFLWWSRLDSIVADMWTVFGLICGLHLLTEVLNHPFLPILVELVNWWFLKHCIHNVHLSPQKHTLDSCGWVVPDMVYLNIEKEMSINHCSSK